MTFLQSRPLATLCGLLMVPLFFGVAHAADETTAMDWFETCSEFVHPDWFPVGSDSFYDCVDDLEGDSEINCRDWLICFEQEYEFTQTRTCMPGTLNPCSQGQSPLPIQWGRLEVGYQINIEGSQDIHPGEHELTDELRNTVFDSFDTWNDLECSELEMVYEGTTTQDEPGYHQDPAQNANIVVWQDDSWPNTGYDAVALTTVNYRPSSGEILSSDIEFNTANYNFTNTDDPDEIRVDIQNTLTHEIGHFFGLDHSPNNVATMFATAPLGEISKRDLHNADIAGICHIYPSEATHQLPESIDHSDQSQRRSGLCTATGGPTPSSLLLIALVVFGLALGRRTHG